MLSNYKMKFSNLWEKDYFYIYNVALRGLGFERVTGVRSIDPIEFAFSWGHCLQTAAVHSESPVPMFNTEPSNVKTRLTLNFIFNSAKPRLCVTLHLCAKLGVLNRLILLEVLQSVFWIRKNVWLLVCITENRLRNSLMLAENKTQL